MKICIPGLDPGPRASKHPIPTHSAPTAAGWRPAPRPPPQRTLPPTRAPARAKVQRAAQEQLSLQKRSPALASALAASPPPCRKIGSLIAGSTAPSAALQPPSRTPPTLSAPPSMPPAMPPGLPMPHHQGASMGAAIPSPSTWSAEPCSSAASRSDERAASSSYTLSANDAS